MSRSGAGVTSGAKSTSGGGGGGGDLYVSPFLFAAIGFCICRMISISVSLSVVNLKQNMQVWFAFEAAGNVLFLLAFTLVALCWCNIVIRADIFKVHFIRLKVALWILFFFVAISLEIAFICFEAYLPQNFGAGAHDFVLISPTGGVTIGYPVNNQLQKPQGFIVTIFFFKFFF